MLFAVFCGLASAPGAKSDDVGSFLAATPTFSGLVLHDDRERTVSAWARGQPAADDAGAMTTDLTWRWASVTKQLVAVLVMQDIQAGRLALTANVADLLPAFDNARAQPVTVIDLLLHTSGLGEPSDLPESMDVDPVRFCDVPVQSPPGQSSVYKNCDFVLLGAVLEAVNKTAWPTLLQRRILTPAGMTGTRVALTLEDDGEVAGMRTDGVPERPRSPARYGAAAAIIGPPGDLLKFNRALLDGRLLTAESRTLLWTGRPEWGFVAFGAWSFPAPLNGCAAPVRLIERRGWVGGVQVRNFIAPERNESVVVFVNRADHEFGEIWTGAGFSHQLLSLLFCAK